MKLYRAISLEERHDLEIHGIFKAIPGQFEGKLFAGSFKDASIFGKNMFKFDQREFWIVKVSVSSVLEYEIDPIYPDEALGVGASYSVSGEILDKFSNNITFKIMKATYNVKYERVQRN